MERKISPRQAVQIDSAWWVVVLVVVAAGSVWGQVPIDSGQILTPESIIRITYENNPGIAAARYRLESAEHNFDLFESEFTQFTPLIVGSKVRRESDTQVTADMSLGMEKEFFDGSSLFLDIGNATRRVSGEATHTQFVEGRVEFPLFSSNRKLSRLIEQTFEENELHNARLEYVGTFRNEIRRATEHYYDLLPRELTLDVVRSYRDKLAALLQESQVEQRRGDAAQIEDEISSLDSDLNGLQVRVGRAKIRLRQQLGVESLAEFQLAPLPLGIGERTYFGSPYVTDSYEDVLARALKSDTEVKVLHRVMADAAERRRLAEEGTWDIFVAGGGRYNQARFTTLPDRKYAVDLGVRIKKFDADVLRHSRAKAESDIRNMAARIRAREAELAAEIGELKQEAENRRKQLKSLSASLHSRRGVYAFKLQRYLEGTESVDNLIQAFRSLLGTERRFYRVANDYFDAIRDLDELCGVYSETLGLQVQ